MEKVIPCVSLVFSNTNMPHSTVLAKDNLHLLAHDIKQKASNS